MALATAVSSEKRDAEKDGNLEKSQQKQTNSNKSTAHKGQSAAHTHYNPK